MTVSAFNAFLGTTSLDAGQLQVDGGLGPGPIVLNGGTLSGMGAVNTVVASPLGGTIAPGNGPGSLNTGPIALNATTNLDVELNGPLPGQFDQLNVTGPVNLAGAT